MRQKKSAIPRNVHLQLISWKLRWFHLQLEDSFLSVPTIIADDMWLQM